jgi:hypothetical protein
MQLGSVGLSSLRGNGKEFIIFVSEMNRSNAVVRLGLNRSGQRNARAAGMAAPSKCLRFVLGEVLTR